jgi:hypothetical protein
MVAGDELCKKSPCVCTARLGTLVQAPSSTRSDPYSLRVVMDCVSNAEMGSEGLPVILTVAVAKHGLGLVPDVHTGIADECHSPRSEV